MTIASKQKNIEQMANEALDHSIRHQLSESVRADIAAARTRALNAAKLTSEQSSSVANAAPRPWQGIKAVLSYQVMVPSAVAVALVILVNYTQIFSADSSTELVKIPPLPLEVMDDTIPSEDLLLLQDIEFAHWLATQEAKLQEASL